MSFTLIIPIAADRPEYDSQLPPVFSHDRSGQILCVKSITGLPLDLFSDIIYVVLKKHNKKYLIREQLRLGLKQAHLQRARIIVLEKPTSCQAETIYKAIEKERITGPIFIKDADGYFTSQEILPQNGVTVYPLEELSLVDPQHKSYVAVDDMNYITNIIERRVVSHYFNAGGYCFEDAKEFCHYYNQLKGYGQIYLSHIIFKMLLDHHIFRPIFIKDYEDWEINQ